MSLAVRDNWIAVGSDVNISADIWTLGEKLEEDV